MEFNVQDLSLTGAKLISPFRVEDNRGAFTKIFEKDVFQHWGLETEIHESIESWSKHGVIRGLHFQTKEPQIKIVRAAYGVIRDIIVDLRKDSPTFGKYIDVILSNENHFSVYVPRGCAHGFEVLSEEAITSYSCVGKYLKEYDNGIKWDDEELNIHWENTSPIVSEKDSHLMSFSEFKKKYEFTLD